MSVHGESSELLQQFFSDLANEGRFSGSVLLFVNDRPLLEESYGIADQTSGRPIGRGTRFQIASVSKQFTAAAILLLREQGALTLLDLLPKWIPDAPSAWSAITLHHLLTHSAGLPHWRDLPQLDLFHPVPWATILAAFASRPLRFPPGTGYAYSSPGYHLLARVVERATGEKYAAFLHRRIFAPLEMTRTNVGNRSAEAPEFALGYEGETPADSFDLDTTGMGAGDVWSTPSDLLRWDRALSRPGMLLNEASLAETFRPHVRIPQEETREIPSLTEAAYGYGWYLAKIGNASVRFHSGDNPGFRALNLWVPAERKVLCVLSNQGRADMLEIGLRALGESRPR